MYPMNPASVAVIAVGLIISIVIGVIVLNGGSPF
jgi:hypothetical protein